MADQPKPNQGIREFRSLSDLTHEKLREAILAGEYATGEWLKERNLAEALGVSTTPVKEALRRLEYEGLVVNVPLRGSYVASNIESTLAEMSVLRASLEGVAAYLAASKASSTDVRRLEAQLAHMAQSADSRDVLASVEANRTFHEMIHAIGRNTFLVQMLDIVRTFDKAFRVRALADEDEIVKGLEDHKAVYEAIAANDPELAENEMRAHIKRTAGSLHESSKKA